MGVKSPAGIDSVHGDFLTARPIRAQPASAAWPPGAACRQHGHGRNPASRHSPDGYMMLAPGDSCSEAAEQSHQKPSRHGATTTQQLT